MEYDLCTIHCLYIINRQPPRVPPGKSMLEPRHRRYGQNRTPPGTDAKIIIMRKWQESKIHILSKELFLRYCFPP